MAQYHRVIVSASGAFTCMVCQFPICAMIADWPADQLPRALPTDVEVLKNDHG